MTFMGELIFHDSQVVFHDFSWLFIPAGTLLELLEIENSYSFFSFKLMIIVQVWNSILMIHNVSFSKEAINSYKSLSSPNISRFKCEKKNILRFSGSSVGWRTNSSIELKYELTWWNQPGYRYRNHFLFIFKFRSMNPAS